MDRPYNVLFICTGNSARSILAEAILRRDGGEQFVAHSAGSRPRGEVHPLALELLEHMEHDTAFARSKSWDEFGAADAPEMDFIFTVCDEAANESCPIWPGHPASAHWGIPDPAAATGNNAEKHVAFARAYGMLEKRIQAFIALPLHSLDHMAIALHLQMIGAMQHDDSAA